MLDLLQDYPVVLLKLTAEMAPYLVLGFLMAGVVHQLFPKTWIKRHLGRGGFMQSFKASVFGVPLPVCSCGIIPLAKELKKSGASNAGVAAFLASTPQTGVDSAIATGGLMSWGFAVVRVVVAFISGILTGGIIGLTEKTHPAELEEDAMPTQPKKPGFSMSKMLYYGLVELPSDIRNSLLLGLGIAALISLFLPQYQEMISANSLWLSYLAVLILAIPLYVCSTGSIPIALALLGSGFSPGSALVFLVAGPATNIVTLVTMTDIIGVKNTIIYLLCVIGIAVACAFMIDLSAMDITTSGIHHHSHTSGITLLQWSTTFLLVGGLLYPPVTTFFKKLKHNNRAEGSLNEYEIVVEGMGCKKCAAKVTGIVESLPNHHIKSIDLDSKKVRYLAAVEMAGPLGKALSQEGYRLTASEAK
jgi:uncharacterized membrane protein YraQ (UPF0718 family)/copper chaperone CopZ